MTTCLRVQVKRGQDSRRYRWLGIGDGDWGFAKGSRQDCVRSCRRLVSYCIGTLRGQKSAHCYVALICFQVHYRRCLKFRGCLVNKGMERSMNDVRRVQDPRRLFVSSVRGRQGKFT